MSLRSIIVSGVAIANRVTRSLQSTQVLHAAWIGTENGYPKPMYDAAISRSALISYTDKMQQSTTGENILVHASVMFLAPIAPNGAAGRREPLDPRDQITLPDGYIGTILEIRGMIDPKTNGLYLYEVSLGG